MKLTHEKIKSFSSLEYRQYRQEIKDYYNTIREEKHIKKVQKRKRWYLKHHLLPKLCRMVTKIEEEIKND